MTKPQQSEPSERPSTAPAGVASAERLHGQALVQAAQEAWKTARHFMPSKLQCAAVMIGINSDDRDFFLEKIVEIANTVQAMPAVGQWTQESSDVEDSADEKGTPTAHLHYFLGGSHWYILEKDPGSADDKNDGIKPGAQRQAWCYAVLNGDMQCAEYGYVDLEEIGEHFTELDFHFRPTPMDKVIEHLEQRYGPGDMSEVVPTMRQVG